MTTGSRTASRGIAASSLLSDYVNDPSIAGGSDVVNSDYSEER